MEQDRRTFLSAALAAAPLFIPRRAWGANDRLAYGLIGAGGRGRYLNRNFQKLGAECVAVSEVYEPNMQAALPGFARTPSRIWIITTCWRRAASTPWWSPRPIISTLRACWPRSMRGKDVYLEKPMSHSLEQSRRMIEAVRKTKQIVQIGMQRRSAESIIKAKQLVDSGILGKITLVKPMWNWNVAHELDNSPLPGQAGLEALPGSGQGPRVAAHAISRVALVLGLLGRQHDRPGHASDGRRAVVHQRRHREIGGVLWADRQDHRIGSARCLLRGVRVRRLDGHLDAELHQLV